MGHISHNAILVTSPDWYKTDFEAAHRQAIELFGELCDVSPILHSKVNAYMSFLIPPDGSKEGWETSDKGDALRKEFIDYLRWLRTRGAYMDFVEISYGGDSELKAWVVQDEENPPED